GSIMTFNAISPLNGGQLNTYYYDAEYPYDLNGALDFVRPATGVSKFPYPQTIGHVEGLLPLFNGMEYSLMLGKTPFGTWVGQLPQDIGAIFPDVSGSMRKVGG
ncbi:MAG: hypothetical protein KGM99_12295, partial [Burkholderiales bacterium]|nr:hypothetical protein [Burkholderiales bacterium]